MFGPEREEIRGEWKGLFTEAVKSLMILHFSRNVVKMKRAGHVASWRGNINPYPANVENMVSP
jgi:hypothetical protein